MLQQRNNPAATMTAKESERDGEREREREMVKEREMVIERERGLGLE